MDKGQPALKVFDCALTSLFRFDEKNNT